jgi:hypothetical protein
MFKHYKQIPLLAATLISFGLTSASPAFAQRVEGLYSENLEAASSFKWD